MRRLPACLPASASVWPILALLSSACDGDDPVEVAEAILEIGTEAVVMFESRTLDLEVAEFDPVQGAGSTVTWSIAQMDTGEPATVQAQPIVANGRSVRIIAFRPDTVLLIAHHASLADTVAVQVRGVTAVSLALAYSTTFVQRDGTLSLFPIVRDSAGQALTRSNFVWSSGDTAVFTVEGRVDAVGAGYAEVTGVQTGSATLDVTLGTLHGSVELTVHP